MPIIFDLVEIIYENLYIYSCFIEIFAPCSLLYNKRLTSRLALITKLNKYFMWLSFKLKFITLNKTYVIKSGCKIKTIPLHVQYLFYGILPSYLFLLTS